MAEDEPQLQHDLYTASSQSVLFWINAFAFTYRKFITDPNGVVRQCTSLESHVPFVTWEIQDEHILEIEKAINTGYDLLTDKSRDMGATWDHICAIHHQWLFKSDRTFLELSRKEDCVDMLGRAGTAGSDPGTLLGKHDYLNRWLPDWMLPEMDRRRMHMVNLSNQSRIDGESSSATAASSDRRTGILLDEMAKMLEGESIKRSTKDVTACRLPNSTPDGPGTAYTKWCKSGQVKVFSMMYYDHPEKGFGRHPVQDELTGKWEITCPWLEIQKLERSPKELAIEVMADHIGSGDTFFESSNIELHRRLFAKGVKIKSRWSIDFKKGVPTEMVQKIIARSQINNIEANRTAKGPLRVWPLLIKGRPDQSRNYVLGIDISNGQGASNSVISVSCIETREKIAEWADANTPPHELARIACALALWVGGSRRNGRPFMIWEANGPGWIFGREIVERYRYPFYFFDHAIGTIRKKKTRKYGWHSSREKKGVLLGMLRRAYAHGGFINHSMEALDEALTYIHYEGGGIGPAELIEEGSEARKCHGDRVIADMLCFLGFEEIPKGKQKSHTDKGNSLGNRKAEWQKRKIESRKQTAFDYRQ